MSTSIRCILPLKVPCLLAVGLLLTNLVTQASQPNIIVIYMDDMGYNDIGTQTYPSTSEYYPDFGPEPQTNRPDEEILPAPNAARLMTPAIDSLAAEGLQMNSFYTARLCSPARASLLTGRYAARQSMGGVFFPASNDGLNTEEVTLPEQLRELGYTTAMVGKWHLGYNPSQTLSFQMMPTRHGFQKFFGFPYSNDMNPYHLIDGEQIIQSDLGGGEANQAKLTWMLTEKALEYIEDSTAQDKPLFLYFAHPMTHIPCWPSNQEFENADGTTWPIFKGSSGVSYYYDVVKEVDHSVARILGKLDDLGVAEDTLIIFTSDNGPWLTLGGKNAESRSVGSAYPLKAGKFTTWEGGVRVPMLLRWPGQIPAGSVSDQLTGVVDLLPTLVALGGGVPYDQDRTIDGVNMWPIWSGASSSLDRAYAMFANGNAEGIRKGQWKLRSGSLYDLDNDIQELTDVSALPANAGVLAELEGLKDSLETSVDTELQPLGLYTNYEIEFSANDIAIDEGSTATVDLRLSHNPGADLSVSLDHFSGDADLSIVTGSSLTFTAANWSDWQTVTLAAGADADALHGGATFRATMGGHSVVRELFVYEVDAQAPAAAQAFTEWPKIDSLTLDSTDIKLIAQGGLTLGGFNNPEGATFRWVKVSGPGAVSFTHPDALKTGLAFETNGLYRLRLYVDHATAGSFGSADFSVNVGVQDTLTVDDYKYSPSFAYNGTSGAEGVDLIWQNVVTAGSRDWTLANSVALTAVDPAPQLSFIDSALIFTGGAIPAGGASDNLSQYATSDASIELWFKPTVLPVSSPQVLWETGGDVGASLTLDGSQIRFAVDDGGSNVPNGAVAAATLAPSAARDGFIHCVGVIDLANDAIKLYLDGSLADTQALDPSVFEWCGTSQSGLGTIASFGMTEVTTTAYLGGNDLVTGAFAPFEGQIAKMLFYDKVLSAVEVADLTGGSLLERTPANRAPTVSAGQDQSVAFTAASSVAGSATDDGLPDPGVITLAWSLADGPAMPDFADATSPSTQVSFNLPGVYKVWLEADDSEIKVYDETQITVAAYTYAEWTQELTFPVGEDAPTDNPDGDPWNNGWEWLFGSDPLVYNANQSFSNSITESAPDELRFRLEFVVPKDRNPDLFLQSTEDLSLPWADLKERTPTIEPIDETTERWSFVLDVDVSTLTEYFVRAKVEL